MFTFSVFGNCQSTGVGELLAALTGATFVPIPHIHLLKPQDQPEVDRVFSSVDLVVHQPIGPAWGQFAFDRVRERHPAQRYLSFPVLFFQGYWPWLGPLKLPSGNLRGMLGTYHDERIVRSFVDGLTPQECLESLRASEADPAHMEQTFATLRKREAALDAHSADFVRGRFRQRKLFFTLNHPRNELMLHVALQLAAKLGVNPEPETIREITTRREYLCDFEFPVDPAVAALHRVQDRGESFYTHNGERREVSLADFISASYRIYADTPEIRGVLQSA